MLMEGVGEVFEPTQNTLGVSGRAGRYGLKQTLRFLGYITIHDIDIFKLPLNHCKFIKVHWKWAQLADVSMSDGPCMHLVETFRPSDTWAAVEHRRNSVSTVLHQSQTGCSEHSHRPTVMPMSVSLATSGGLLGLKHGETDAVSSVGAFWHLDDTTQAVWTHAMFFVVLHMNRWPLVSSSVLDSAATPFTPETR